MSSAARWRRHGVATLALASFACAGDPLDLDVQLATDTTVSPTDTSSDTGAVPVQILEACVVTPPRNPCDGPSGEGLSFGPATTDGDIALHPYDATLQSIYAGGGVSVADLDLDGRLDIVVGNHTGIVLYRQQANGDFDDETRARVPAEVDTSRVAMSTLADIDDDGDLDMVIARELRRNVLLINDGTGHFTDASSRIHVAGAGGTHWAGASLADMDRDGDLDLFLAGYGAFHHPLGQRPPGNPSLLLRNDGDGTFTDISSQLTDEFQDGYTFVGGWIDVDMDGFPELYGVNDFGYNYPNVLLRNREGSLEAWSPSNGLDVALDGMGLEWGDLDNDGDHDLMVSGLNENRVMLQEDDGQFFDHHTSLDIEPDAARHQYFTWAPHWADVNHDMRLDVMQAVGAIWDQPHPADQQDALYMQTVIGEGELAKSLFYDRGTQAGVAHEGQTRGLLMADLNDDGWLDLVRQDLTGPVTVQYRACDEGNWMKIRPRQPGQGNPFAVGARIEVHTGDVRQQRHIEAGSHGVFTSRPYEAHVGLSDHATVDRVEVHWPDGTTTTCEDVPANHNLTVNRLADPQ